MDEATERELDERAKRCHVCGKLGIQVPGTWHLADDEPDVQTPDWAPASPLMFGEPRGAWTDHLMCQACSRDHQRASDIMDAADREGTVQPPEAVRLFPGKPEWHTNQSVRLALKRAGVSQAAVNCVTKHLDWADPPDLSVKGPMFEPDGLRKPTKGQAHGTPA